MLRFNLCFSAKKQQRMQDRKKALKKVKASFKDGIYLLICLVVAASIFGRVDIKLKTPEVKADGGIKTVEVTKEVLVKAPDERVVKLKSFLESKKSPMAPYAQLIVEEADKNDIGFTWITGISCIESACGLKLPQNSYNAWGLGGSKFMYFKSWEESIKYMSQLIGSKYRHNILQGIKQNYCPSSDGCNPNWSKIVAQASKDINENY